MVSVMDNDLEKWWRRMAAGPLKKLANQIAIDSVSSQIFKLGRKWERMQFGALMFRVGDRVRIKQMHPDEVAKRAQTDCRHESETVDDYIAASPSYEGVIVEQRLNHNGCLVRHDTGGRFGWGWNEIEPPERTE